MQLLDALKTFLLTELQALQARPDALHIFIEDGELVTHEGQANYHFRVRYTIALIMDGVTIDITQLLCALNIWQSTLPSTHQLRNAPRFSVVPVTKDSRDISVGIDLQETIKVDANGNSIALAHANTGLDTTVHSPTTHLTGKDVRST